MRIDRIRLVNFRQHELTEIEFGAGLTGIVGPNGAGKTTILEAIAWVMYGTKAARGNRDELRRIGAPPRSRVEVELEFSLGRHHYRVVRTPNGAELYQDGGAAPVANSTGAVTERISRLLGMTRDEFFSTYFTGQKDLARMASLTAAERARFLSRVLGYERIRTAQERLKEMRQAVRLRVNLLESALPDANEVATAIDQGERRHASALAAVGQGEAALAAAAAALDALLPRFASLREARDRRTALESDRRVQVAGLDSARERVAALESAVAEARAAQQELAALEEALAPLAALRAEDAALDASARAWRAERERIAQRDSARARLTEVGAAIARLPDTEALDLAHARASSLRASLQDLGAQVEELRTGWVRDAADAQSNRNVLLAQFKDLEAQHERIVELGRDGACPTCARPLGAEFDRVLGMLERQMEEVKSNGLYYKRRIDQLKAEPAELESMQEARRTLDAELAELMLEKGRIEAQVAERRTLRREREKLEARLAELETASGPDAAAHDAQRHDEVRARMAALEPAVLRAERLRDAAGRAEARGRELAEATERAGRIAAELAALDAALAGLRFDEAAYVAAGEEMARAEAQRRDAELATVRARSERDAAAEALAAARRRGEEAEQRRRDLREARQEQQLYDELDRALNDLRTDLNQQMRPELSSLASEFVRDLTAGRYTELELNESYEATLLDDGDPKRVISGGEEDVANLALRLAISQMIAERAGQPLSLLVLDEIFGSLDEERRLAVLALLRGLADRFPQVILITHIDSVREGFDRVIRVGYDVARGVAVVRDDTGDGHGLAA